MFARAHIAARLRWALPAVAACVLVFAPAAHAATMTFGSSLSVPAADDTANNLSYTGTDIPTIDPGPPPRAVTVHINHDGADTALWATSLAGGSAGAPAAGQVTEVRMEGCARAAAGGPAPIVDIHFQDLVPQGGSYRVDVTTQTFQMPICGQPTGDGSTATADTVTTFQPTNFCVHAGDAVAFNDEGGFDPKYYPSGVAFQVLGAVPGSVTDSFIRNNGTNNGAVFSPTDVTNHDGFATNRGLELLLQATLATGPDATPLCPGGTKGVPAPAPPPPPPPPNPGQPGGPPALVLRKQTDGVNHRRFVGLAVYCARVDTACTGTVSVLSAATGAAAATQLGAAQLKAPPKKTVHVKMRLTPAALVLIRHHHRRLPATLTVRLPDGTSVSQAITLRI